LNRKEAGELVVRVLAAEERIFLFAALLDVAAARRETAAWGRVSQIGRQSRDARERLGPVRPQVRY
jgi:hypothetical protein